MGAQTVLHSANPYNYTITGLTNGTAYQVRITYQDVDGIIAGTAINIIANVIPSNQLIHNSATTRSAKWGGLWGVAGGKYGEFTCYTCHESNAANIKALRSVIASPNSPLDSFPGSSVVALDARDGQSSYGDDLGTHATSTKVCEVCHSQTSYHRYDTAGQTVLDHNNARDCTRCHRHNTGFRGSGCDSCHGNPPINIATMVGFTNPSSTGSITAGAHNKHANDRGITCETCHSGSAGSGVTHDAGTVTIGFSIFNGNYDGGTYDGQATVTYDSTSFTSITNTDSLTCSGVYCHSNAMPLSGTNVYASPVWNDGSGQTCGSCHSAPGDVSRTWSSSHNTHAANYAYTCDNCHSLTAGSNSTIVDYSRHVNDVKDVAMAATYGGTYAAGQCSNVYCHSNGNGGVGAVVPEWTVTVMTCDSCHLTPPGTGSHNAHTVSANCTTCHNATTSDGATIADKTKHANKVKDIVFATGYGGTYTPGVGCSNVYCHDSSSLGVLSPAWGGSLPDKPECDSCHGGNRNSTNTAGNGPMTMGAHTAHMNNADINLGSFGCGKCHAATVTDGNDRLITGPSSHVNMMVDVPTACTTCHKDGHGTAVSPPAWTSGTNLTCKGCHGTSNSLFGEPGYLSTNSHPKHVKSATDCGKCHNSTSTTGTSITGALHLNGVSNVNFDAQYGGTYTQGVGCSSVYCHDPSSIGTVSPVWGVGTLPDTAECDSCHGGNKTSTNTAGKGPITTGAHTAHIANADVNLGTFYCSKCHYNTVTNGNDRYITGTVHVNRTVDVPVTCTTACHNDGHGTSAAPPTWTSGTNLACKGCHGSTSSLYGEPDYVGSNSHAKHVSAASDCAKCHNSTTTTGTSITGTIHLNSVVNVSMSSTYGGTYTAGTGCSNVYCHSVVQLDGGTAVTGLPGEYKQSPAWGTAIVCGDCHAAVPATGKHGLHITGASAVCGDCHNGAGNGTVAPASGHANMSVEVSGGTTKITSYDSAGVGNGYGTCSNIVCHDGNSAAWIRSDVAGTVSCGDCHTDPTDIDDYTYKNGTAAKIGSDEWGVSAHGSTTRAALACTTCHTRAVAHNTAGNYFRLTSSNNSLCMNCHSGLNPSYPNAPAVDDVLHYGVKHNATFNGGTVCWDCHDPHGDRGSAEAGPIASIHKRPWLAHDADGKPTKISTIDTDFTGTLGALAWTDFVKPGPNFNGVCQTCHESSATIANFYRYDTYPNVAGSYNTAHYQGTGCKDCHRHPAFEPTGCNVCHPFPATSNAHTKHINNIVAQKGLTEAPAGYVGNPVCGVCHNATSLVWHGGSSSFNGNYRNIFSPAPTTVADQLAYQFGSSVPSYDKAGTKTCSNVSCHLGTSPSWGTAEASCGTCHGDDASGVPLTAGGLANPPTGHGPGKHQQHAVTNGIPCNTCHNNNGMPTPDNVITVSFTANATGGQYDGATATLNAGYTYAGTLATTPTATGQTCAVYCHSIVQTDGGGPIAMGTADYRQPDWETGTIQCGDCHNGDGVNGNTASVMNSGSHTDHLSTGAVCDNCHTGSTHVNGAIEVAASLGYSGDTLPGNGTYGSCSSACHNNGVGQVTSPTWGSTVPQCSECHLAAPATYAHSAHLNGGAVCANCHAGAVQGSTPPTVNHRNGVSNVDGGAIVWNSTTHQCSNASCHNDGLGTLVLTPDWRAGAVNDCSECHATRPTTGAHSAHMNNGATCGSCHDATVEGTTAPARHRDGTKEVYDVNPGDLGFTAGSCSTSPCHTTVQGSSADNMSATAGTQNTTPDWSTGHLPVCGGCHAAVPTTGKHTNHLTNYGATCTDCHEGAPAGTAASPPTTTPTMNHYNGTINLKGTLNYSLGGTIVPGAHAYGNCTDPNSGCHSSTVSRNWGGLGAACGSCHTYPPATGAHNKHTTHLSTVEAKALNENNVTWNAASHPVCAVCHDMGLSVNHEDTADYIVPDSPHSFNGGVPSYDSVNQRCSNVNCHFQPTPKWKCP
ncbi:MAG: CxxxxCH/CxxCH domain-containing protein [Nitrospirae bacterium]|nr:CxxxxCH/CxxCH domain-containing protein [Nitrospirota bacterium]